MQTVTFEHAASVHLYNFDDQMFSITQDNNATAVINAAH